MPAESKSADGNWIHKAILGLKSTINFEYIGVELNLEEVYQRVEFEEENI